MIYILLGLYQIINIICYGLFTTYDIENVGALTSNNNSSITTTNTVNHYYPFFQDVHVMIFIGFGFLMTYLYRYSFSSIGYNFLLSSLAIQQSILINSFFHNLLDNHWEKISLNIESLITGDFAAGAVMISFGALLGKASILQLALMLPLELIFYALNEAIGVLKYQAVDMGGSMYVHTFGAFFGLAVSYIITDKKKIEDSKHNFFSKKESDLFAMIGTLFLWVFWPSFNGALAVGNSQHRVVINTVLSLTNSCISAFIFSKIMRKNFDMVDIQNATLAGGVAVGSSADLVIGPYASLIVGSIAGIVSVIGYTKITPYLEKKLNIHDTCGVNNLHGIPGIIGGLTGAISSVLASDEVYGDSIIVIFAARDHRSSRDQGVFQLLALITTLGISIIGGLITGKICSFFENYNKKYSDDLEEWDIDNFNENLENV